VRLDLPSPAEAGLNLGFARVAAGFAKAGGRATLMPFFHKLKGAGDD
jgi:hypothetical protein